MGGGYGEVLAAILLAFPAMEGVLFDLPHTMDGARQHLARADVIERCEFVSGDFFESVPGGADAYLLKALIHDWDDQQNARILRNCRKAMWTQSCCWWSRSCPNEWPRRLRICVQPCLT